MFRKAVFGLFIVSLLTACMHIVENLRCGMQLILTDGDETTLFAST